MINNEKLIERRKRKDRKEIPVKIGGENFFIACVSFS